MLSITFYIQFVNLYLRFIAPFKLLLLIFHTGSHSQNSFGKLYPVHFFCKHFNSFFMRYLRTRSGVLTTLWYLSSNERGSGCTPHKRTIASTDYENTSTIRSVYIFADEIRLRANPVRTGWQTSSWGTQAKKKSLVTRSRSSEMIVDNRLVFGVSWDWWTILCE